jgi:hypothetical protein
MALRATKPGSLSLLLASVAVCAALLLAALAPAQAGAREISKRVAGTRVSLSTAKALGGHKTKKSAKKVRSGAGGGPLYWGAWIGEQFTGAQAPWDMNAVSSFEKVADKSLSLVNFSSPFAACSGSSCSYYKFPTGPMENVRSHGAIPFFSWASQSSPSSLNQPNFQLADVADGNFDSYIREFATEAKAWGHPFFLRFNWEMNGNWFPWSEGVNGNGPGSYVAAWRHVHDIFASVGATNATWVWCPNIDPGGKLHDLASLYPGDEYVDWTCLDGYNWGPSPYHPEKWKSFGDLFGSTYDTITEQIAPSKPMIIGETGCNEAGGSKSEWIQNMLREIPSEFPKIRGLQWFEKNEEGEWPIESSQSSASAFSAGIQNQDYVGNDFASIAGTIQPPS